MTGHLGIFDPPPAAVAATSQPIARRERGLDVIRVLTHKAGPFRRLDESGKVIGEYLLLERPTGYFAEYTDGRPETRVCENHEHVESMLRQGIWRVVE